MPFGSADRELLRQVGNQLSQIAAELAALKQQAADQQHSIDQTRQDTNADITTGLAEIRALARDGLARTNEIATGPLSSIGNELVAIRGAITQLGNQVLQAVAPPTPEPAPEPVLVEDTPPAPDPEPQAAPEPEVAPQSPSDDDLAILRAAAGISAAELQMHRDAWAFLIEQTAGEEHFHIPGKVEDQDGAVTVRVSGPSLVAAITSLDRVNRSAVNPVTSAIAGHLHARLTETVEEIITRPHRGDGADPVRIVIDDRAKPDSSED
ncbi:hypothetical protein ABIE67_007888 [Streptomyces sp. V4I8]|uniref:hypothetical protein n=1 Tax=Streptomyces sp. V4I8 TaxID=3156469 RepID=UPI0035119E9C